MTFLFTDLEGSTRLWQEHAEAMKGALARHDEILRDAIAFAAAGFSGPLGGASLETEQRALAQARQELGSDAADDFRSRVAAMSYDEMVPYLRAELDRAIGSTAGS